MKIDFNFIQVIDCTLPEVHNRVLRHVSLELAQPVLPDTIVCFAGWWLVDSWHVIMEFDLIRCFLNPRCLAGMIQIAPVIQIGPCWRLHMAAEGVVLVVQARVLAIDSVGFQSRPIIAMRFDSGQFAGRLVQRIGIPKIGPPDIASSLKIRHIASIPILLCGVSIAVARINCIVLDICGVGVQVGRHCAGDGHIRFIFQGLCGRFWLVVYAAHFCGQIKIIMLRVRGW